jgi:hypothetical protein
MSASKVESNLSVNAEPEWLALVKQQVGSLRFGVVQIVIHDAQVTQVEKTERVRLGKFRETADNQKTS